MHVRGYHFGPRRNGHVEFCLLARITDIGTLLALAWTWSCTFPLLLLSFPTQLCIYFFVSMTSMPVLFLYVCLEVCLAQLLARWGRKRQRLLTTMVTFRFPRASSDRRDARNIVLQSGTIPAGQPCISSLSTKCMAMVTRRHPSRGMRSSFRNKR